MTNLIERAEAIEACAWADLVAAAPDEARQAAGLAVEAIGRARVISATGLDGVFFNRAIGLRGDDLGAIRQALRHYEARGIARYFLHLGPAARDLRVGELLRSYGIERYRRAWDKFIRDARRPAPDRATDLVFRRATEADAEACGALVASAFDLEARTAPLFAAAVGRPGWHVVIGRAPDEPHGEPLTLGALFVDGGLGYLAFGATAPAYRGRGGQGATMAWRIREAAARGCRWLTTETGEPVPDEPSPSHGNMRRCGFEIAQRRDNYAPIGFSWTRAA